MSVSVSTAVLNLDATVLILTPVVLVAIAHLGLDHRPYTLSTAHLANSASLLMPVSNLTNLLVFHESGLSFTRFTMLMLLPWLGAIAVEWFLLPRVMSRQRKGTVPAVVEAERTATRSGATLVVPETATLPDVRPDPWPVVVLSATLLGFLASGLVGIEPVWVAWAGALLITGPALTDRSVSPAGVLRSLKPLFLLFVCSRSVSSPICSTGPGSTT